MLAAVDGALEEELERLERAAAACGRAQWLLLDRGQGLAEALASQPRLARHQMRAVAGGRWSGPWERFCAAAALVDAPQCLLLPSGTAPDAALMADLRAALRSADLVYSRREPLQGWALALQGWVWGLPGLDLGAPALVRGDRWQAWAQAYRGRGPLAGPRLARALLGAGVGVRQCAAPGLPAPAQGLSVLGQALGAGEARHLSRAGIGAVLMVLALALVQPYSHFLGLSLAAAGFFLICVALGGD